MVTLSRIYTRNGDAGTTRLSDMSETSKTDPRVKAYGDVDEANAIIGVALATGGLPDDITAALHHIQNDLFDVGADLSNPLTKDPPYEQLRVVQPAIDRLEAWCDAFTDALPVLTSFILPGGTLAAAHLHVARTTVRRAERSAWQAAEAYGTEEAVTGEGGGVNLLAVTYLNRLSDLLFIMARIANEGVEILWVPGKDRTPTTSKAQRQRQAIADQQADSSSRGVSGGQN